MRFFVGANGRRAMAGAARASVLSLLVVTAGAGIASAQPLFTAPQLFSIPVGDAPHDNAIEAADLNNDGNPDLVVGNTGNDDVSVLYGNGDGTFAPQRRVPAGNTPSAVAVGDFNEDGYKDLAVSNETSNNVVLLLGRFDGSFTNGGTLSVPSGPNYLRAAHINTDSHADIVAIAYSSGNCHVFLGNGDGTFAVKTPFAAGFAPSKFVVDDFDENGTADLAVVLTVGPSSGFRVFGGNGDGTFASPQPFNAAGNGTTAIARGYFNADSHLDVVVVNRFGFDISVFLGNGDGTFGAESRFPGIGVEIWAAAATDLDEDGDLDIAVAGGAGAIVIPGNGDGTFGAATGYSAGVSAPVGLVAADFNLDGHQDVAAAGFFSDSVGVLLGYGTGTLGLPPILGMGPTTAGVTAADLNADGHPDLVGANFGSTSISIRLANGAGGFLAPSTLPVGSAPLAVAVGHFNADLIPDLAVANVGSSDVSLYLGTGGGSFGPEARLPAGTEPRAIATADIDEDGDEDIVVTNRGSDSLSLLFGNGDGTFQPQTLVAVADGPTAIAIADFDDDAHLDLAVANRFSSDVVVLLGGGNGTFGSPMPFAVGTTPRAVATGDFNGDGNLDLTVANAGSHSLSILLGDGNGDFSPQPAVDSLFNPFCVMVGDFNADGNDDLVSANNNTSPSPVAVFLGRGDGTFFTGPSGDGIRLLDLSGVAWIAVADLNGDARQDLAIANSSGVSLHFNLGVVPVSVTSVDPMANALDAGPATNISVTLSEPVISSTVTTASFRLLAGGVPVPATVSLATSRLRATLDPVAPLALGTTYKVEVTTGVKDDTLTAAAPFTSFFRTPSAPAGGTELPTVSDEAAGPGPMARSGHAVAQAGDVNGDGLMDFLAGAPSFQATGGPVEAGEVSLYFGSTDSTERESADIVFTGASAHDRVGSAVAGRFDFNEDGFMDILVGAEQVNRTQDNDPAAGCNAGQPCGPGKVYLIYFNPNNTAHYPNIGNPSVPDVVSLALVGQPGGIPGVVFTGVSLGDLAGYAVAAGGRVRGGSTRPSIAIGAPKRTVVRPLAPPPSLTGDATREASLSSEAAGPGPSPLATETAAGVVYVIFGDPALTGTLDLSRVANGQGDQIAGVVYEGAVAGDELGYTVAFPGDVMGTVGDDLAIGAPYADPVVNSTTLTDAGIAYVIQGGSLTTGTVNVSDIGTLVDGTQIVGTQAGMLTGWSLAGGGDNQVDGTADLLIGSPLYDDALLVDSGKVSQTSVKLVKGTTQIDTIGATGTCTVPGVAWLGAASGDQLGYAVAGVGDVTGDGYDDIALAAPLADPVVSGSAVTDAGTVYLIYGAPPAEACRGLVNVSEVGNAIAGVQLVGTTPNEQAGASLAGTGDLSGDGYNDFVVGAPLKDVGGDPDAGTVYEVLDAHEVPPATCSSSGFEVADLGAGTSASFTSESLSCPLTVTVTGITEQGLLGAAPPAGTGLAGAIDIEPAGIVLAGTGAHVIVGLHPLYTSLSPSALRVHVRNGGTWTDTGINAAVGVSPFYPNRLSAQAHLPAGSVFGTYALFTPDTDGDGIADYLDNCPQTANTSQADVDGDIVGDVCDNCATAYNPGQENPDGDVAGSACDVCPDDADNDADNDGWCSGPTYQAPKVGANDNCPLIPNASQADANLNGIGDACEGACSVTVDDSGGADFTLVQAALAHLYSLGLANCQVRVQDGTYLEQLSLTAPIEIMGMGPGTPVIDGGGSGTTVSVSNPATGPVILRNLELRGGVTGLTTTRQVDLYDVSIRQVASGGVGLEVLAQTTTMRGGRIEVNAGAASTGIRVAGATTGTQAARTVLGDQTSGTVYRNPIPVLVPGGTGVDVAAGKSADLYGVEVRTAATGLRAAGVVNLASSLVADGTTGVQITSDAGAQVTADYVTLASETTGIANANGSASSLTVRHGLVHGNGTDLGDLATCAQVFNTDTATPDCTGGGNPNGNLDASPQYVDAGNADPLLRDYHLIAPSVVPDNGTAGTKPSQFTGPCRDLSGNPRLRDANGDGLAITDLGAYEMGRQIPGCGEVQGLVFQSRTTLSWSPEPSAATYCIYRGMAGTGGVPLGTCLDLTALQCGTGTTTITDTQDPPVGAMYHYLVQAVDGASVPGTLGNGTCNERTPANLCQ